MNIKLNSKPSSPRASLADSGAAESGAADSGAAVSGYAVFCLAVFCLTVSLVGTLGCGGSSPASDTADAAAVQVIYQEQPLADVWVRLHETADGPAIAQAISGNDGRAVFVTVPSPEPAEYFVSMESVGDGGWILDPNTMQKQREPFRVDSFENATQQTIRLPNGAVRSLQPNNRFSR